jgi:hypothetical protein
MPFEASMRRNDQLTRSTWRYSQTPKTQQHPRDFSFRKNEHFLLQSAFFHGIFVMDMRNSFFALFVIVLEKFSEKKIGTITKESWKIRSNCNCIFLFCTYNKLKQVSKKSSFRYAFREHLLKSLILAVTHSELLLRDHCILRHFKFKTYNCLSIYQRYQPLYLTNTG